MRALIVDDNEISRKLLQAVLEAEGYETSLANDGQEALNILEQVDINCIISDIMMPNVDGFSLLYKVKNNARLKNIIFIMYSVKEAFHDDEKFALIMGADKYIQKTGRTSEIIYAIQELLAKTNKKSSQSQLAYRQSIAEKYGVSLQTEQLESPDPLEISEMRLKLSIEKLEVEIKKRKHELIELKKQD